MAQLLNPTNRADKVINADNDNHDHKLDPEILKAVYEIAQKQLDQQSPAPKKMLQEQVDEGVRQLREIARDNNLVWPEDDG